MSTSVVIRTWFSGRTKADLIHCVPDYLSHAGFRLEDTPENVISAALIRETGKEQGGEYYWGALVHAACGIQAYASLREARSEEGSLGHLVTCSASSAQFGSPHGKSRYPARGVLF